jgi:hypothetical protein
MTHHGFLLRSSNKLVGFCVVDILWTLPKLENAIRSVNIESVLDCGVHGDPKLVRQECETKDICHRFLHAMGALMSSTSNIAAMTFLEAT